MKEILKQLHLSEFVVIDFETTGLNPANDAVLEFSGIRFIDGEPKEIKSFLCDPGIEIPVEIELLTGITTQMVAGQAPFEKRLKEAITFIGESPIVGHNIGFDLAFLKEYMRREKQNRKSILKNFTYDTSLMAQAFFFYLHNHRLTTVTDYCGFSTKDAHRAETDSLNTGRIFLCLIREALKYDFDTFQTINRILEGTNDPNKWLYLRLLERLSAAGSIGSDRTPAIDWRAPDNIIGKKIESADSEIFRKNSTNALAERFFGNSGKVAAVLKNFEPRRQQKEMAKIVLDSLLGEQSAMIEAGTGVGKTLAYLVPSILWLNGNGKDDNRVIVASNTKNLQEQIFYKEIPFISNELKLPFKAVLLKGRNNYICKTRWNRFLADIGNSLGFANRSAVIPIVIWLKHTKTGDIGENNGFQMTNNFAIWKEICSEPGFCTTSVCQKYDGCYLGKIRHHSQNADVVIVNHSLLLADSVSDSHALPDYSVLIVDEAHNLEKNAYANFAEKINLMMLTYLLNDVSTGTTVERGIVRNIIDFCRQIKKLHEVEPIIEKIKDNVSDLRITAEVFFKKIANTQSANRNSGGKNYGVKKRFKVFVDAFPNFEMETSTFAAEMNNLYEKLAGLNEKMKTLVADFPELYDELNAKLANAFDDLDFYRKTFKKVTTGNDEKMIFWYEIAPGGKETTVELACTPLAVNTEIFEKILKLRHTTILTSATLRIAGSFDYLGNRTGAMLLDHDSVQSVAVGSPFRYSDQMKFITVSQQGGEIQSSVIASILIRLAKETQRGILTLFTSYSSLGEVYKLIAPTFKNMGITLLAQGHGGSRSSILDQFRGERNSVLLGTDSFWEGVDVIGNSLEILVITKLPFPVPSEPIIEANVEKFKEEGKNSFNDYYVPEAVLKFRQGVGRLIRSTSDIGVVINLDNRIDRMSYGRFFKDCVPVTTETVAGEDKLIQSVQQFFGKDKV
ncbi:MAG: helicase C-terminal domain-containing protein [Candidatus Neomarinimicrobiota bacterium]